MWEVWGVGVCTVGVGCGRYGVWGVGGVEGMGGGRCGVWEVWGVGCRRCGRYGRRDVWGVGGTCVKE